MPEIPSPVILSQMFPLSLSQKKFIEESRKTIGNILNGQDKRYLLILGPCSIHDKESTIEYMQSLKKFAWEMRSVFFICMRMYFEKPRTLHGWKGFAYDPLLDNSNNMKIGLEHTRELLIVLAKNQVPAATEFLSPFIEPYISDLISWGSIGARTVTSQIHRQLASSLNVPIGFKNNTDGNSLVAVQGMLSAAHPQTFLGLKNDGSIGVIHAKGNNDTHLILRGGETQPNYDPASITLALRQLSSAQLPLRLLIDCSHDNSEKKLENQIKVFQSVIHQIQEGNREIRGMMIESHLKTGNQSALLPKHLRQYGVSVTDPCLDWDTTKQLILWGYKKLANLNRKTPCPLMPPAEAALNEAL